MAALMCRQTTGLVRRVLGVSAARYSDYTPSVVDPQKGKVASDEASMPDTLGHAVGAERFELLAKLKGIEDPFEMNVKKRAAGTLDEPNLIPSLYDKRLVGCVCEEDATCINWMHLHKGESRRCECGYWFKLVEIKPEDYGLEAAAH